MNAPLEDFISQFGEKVVKVETIFYICYFRARQNYWSNFGIILIKITQCQDLETIFLQNHTTDFDETLHVVWICPGKGFGTIGTFGYSLV